MNRFSLVLALLVVPRLAVAQAAPSDSELPCNKVPGSLVATTLGGRLLDTHNPGWLDPGESRCNYALVFPRDTARVTYVLWTYPASDYDGLKEVSEHAQDVPGVGDAAHTYIDPDTHRYWLTAVRRARIAISATGPDFALVKKLAILALTRYR